MKRQYLLRIATRKSPLALIQANYIKQKLQELYPDIQVDLLTLTTSGDKWLDTPLASVGGKGLFVKELENALLEKRADLAVHSLKDVPVEFPPGLGLSIICQRLDPRDTLVLQTPLADQYTHLQDLPSGTRVGTSSLRRQCQLNYLHPDLNTINLRGNVQTRLRKLDNGEFDAIILAAAGLKRLQLSARISAYLDPSLFLPAVGQGVLAIESRTDDQALLNVLAPLDHAPTRSCVSAERALNQQLNGGCQVPIAAHAQIETTEICLRAAVGYPDGRHLIRGEQRGPIDNAQQIGIELAQDLLKHGADKILRDVIKAAEN